MGVAPLRSTSILPTLTLPSYSPASSSTIGAIARQGPHQAAQKSSRTGLSDFSTSESKLASVTSTVVLLAILPPDLSSSDKFPQRGPFSLHRAGTSIVAPMIGCSTEQEGRTRRSHHGVTGRSALE